MQNEWKLKELKEQLSDRTAVESLKIAAEYFPGKIIFTTSFGIEDQVITHMIFSNNIEIDVATLDTGRLFPETYKVFNETIKKYGKKIKVFFPDNAKVENMVTEKGPFSFYYSVENRHECCGIRKTEPLKRLLEGRECWIAGIRADQSDNRMQMCNPEFDLNRNVIKYYPIFNWSIDEVKDYIRFNNIPYNILHDKGFVSIGCEPCTRAVKSGEDFRAGRWWWEKGSGKECGLHEK